MGLFDEEIDKQIEQSGKLLKLNGRKLNVIEMFSGYGSQCLGLKYLGLEEGKDFVSHRTCEWAVNSILAYKNVHRPDDNTDYSIGLSREELIDTLTTLGISFDYCSPASREQIARKSDDWLRMIYNAIKSCNNMVNVCNVKGKDLGLKENETYLMTYSYPCQDISVAGEVKGFTKGSGTRSSLLWEIERILNECKELNNTLPQILLLENVPMVHSKDNIQDFNEWQDFLMGLGYHNFWQDLNARDFMIPQNRQRTFMVSLLDDYCYNFPDKLEYDVRLKDLLEEVVDEKFYLSKAMIDYCTGVNQKESKFPRGQRFQQSVNQTNLEGIATTISTNAGNRPVDNFVVENYKDFYDENHFVPDIIDTTNEEKSVYTDLERKLFTEDGNIRKYINSDIIYKFEEGQMVTTSFPNGYAHGTRVHNDCITLNTIDKPSVKYNFRIRKLTCRECFRLMGVRDDDSIRMLDNLSNATCFHLAGDSIVTTCIMAIMSKFYNINLKDRLDILLENIRDKK